LKKIIVTGGAGFIGSHVCEFLVNRGIEVFCIDNFDSFYNRYIKETNILSFKDAENFHLIEKDICDESIYQDVKQANIDGIIHLAAKAGVRPSIENPTAYQYNNVMGTQNLLELAKKLDVKKFIFASSSSVYGINPEVPWSESNKGLLPISPYAASKVSGELLGHVYSELYDIQFLALRFFTVYGPRQRPDLAINKFVSRIVNDIPIQIYGDGTTRRDYTFVKDIVSGISAAITYNKTKYEVINIGNNNTVQLSDLVKAIEKVIGKKAIIEHVGEMPGDVPLTYADISKAQSLLEYAPKTSLIEGLTEFYNWYKLSNATTNSI